MPSVINSNAELAPAAELECLGREIAFRDFVASKSAPKLSMTPEGMNV